MNVNDIVLPKKEHLFKFNYSYQSQTIEFNPTMNNMYAFYGSPMAKKELLKSLANDYSNVIQNNYSGNSFNGLFMISLNADCFNPFVNMKTNDKHIHLLTAQQFQMNDLGNQFKNLVNQCLNDKDKRLLLNHVLDDYHFPSERIADEFIYYELEQQIVLMFLLTLVNKIQFSDRLNLNNDLGCLILIDEIENQLTVPMLNYFINALNSLMALTNSVTICTTNSLFVLENMPTSNVFNIVKSGNAQSISNDFGSLTFGENHANLERLLHYENNQTYFYNVIKKIANENPKLTYKEIMENTQSNFELGQSGKMMLMIDLRCRE